MSRLLSGTYYRYSGNTVESDVCCHGKWVQGDIRFYLMQEIVPNCHKCVCVTIVTSVCVSQLSPVCVCVCNKQHLVVLQCSKTSTFNWDTVVPGCDVKVSTPPAELYSTTGTEHRTSRLRRHSAYICTDV